jgi:hypothetical protein
MVGGGRLVARTLRSFLARCVEDYTYFYRGLLFVGLVWRGGGPEDSHGEGEQRTQWRNTLRSQKPLIVSNILRLCKKSSIYNLEDYLTLTYPTI